MEDETNEVEAETVEETETEWVEPSFW